jgi:hypothetical protein
VKAEIPDKIKMKAAEKKAAEIMSQVDVALGAAATANNNKYPDDVFDQLKKKFKDGEARPRHHAVVRPKQRRGHREDRGPNSTCGRGRSIRDEGRRHLAEGRTSKGVVLFRLSKKIDALDPASRAGPRVDREGAPEGADQEEDPAGREQRGAGDHDARHDLGAPEVSARLAPHALLQAAAATTGIEDARWARRSAGR